MKAILLTSTLSIHTDGANSRNEEQQALTVKSWGLKMMSRAFSGGLLIFFHFQTQSSQWNQQHITLLKSNYIKYCYDMISCFS